MKIIHWNGFKGFYVITKDDQSYDGMRFYFWAETYEECEKWIKNNG